MVGKKQITFSTNPETVYCESNLYWDIINNYVGKTFDIHCADEGLYYMYDNGNHIKFTNRAGTITSISSKYAVKGDNKK